MNETYYDVEQMQAATEAISAWVTDGAPHHDCISFEKWQRRWAASQAVRALLPTPGPDTYWRCTNRKEEHSDMLSGVALVSKDHRDGSAEAGLSVSTDVFYACGYRWAYKVTGKLAGTGSDGEPVIVDCKPVGKLMTAKKAIDDDNLWAEEIQVQREIAVMAGIDREQVGYLASLIWRTERIAS